MKRPRRHGEGEQWPRGVDQLEVGGTYMDSRGEAFACVKVVNPIKKRVLVGAVNKRGQYRYFHKDCTPADGRSPLPLWWFASLGPNGTQLKALTRAGLVV